MRFIRSILCFIGWHGEPVWSSEVNHNKETRRVFGYYSFLKCPYCDERLSGVAVDPMRSSFAFHGKQPIIDESRCDCGAYANALCSGFCYAQTPQTLQRHKCNTVRYNGIEMCNTCGRPKGDAIHIA